MTWIEVRATFKPGIADTSPVVEIFRAHGIENTLEENDELVGCLVDVDGTTSVLSALTADLEANSLIESVSAQPLVEQDWEEAWKQFFHPRRVGRHFVVRPTWEEYNSGPDDHIIVLDPGQAFGTGDHPTTRLCLELMEDAGIAGAHVADVGCGSGILSIGAVQIGAAAVEAVDIDPLCVEVARENAKVNSVQFAAVAGEGIAALNSAPPASTGETMQDETPLGELNQLDEPAASGPVAQYDVVISNIISATLIRIAPDVEQALRPGGRWIVSGIIEANWPDVRMQSERWSFQLRDERHEDGWVAALFVK